MARDLAMVFGLTGLKKSRPAFCAVEIGEQPRTRPAHLRASRERRRRRHGADSSSQFGCFAACSAISSRILCKGVSTCQCHSFSARLVSSTIHGRSKGRGLRSAPISLAPKRVVHHALSCASDMLFITLPPKLQIRFLPDGASICRLRIDTRSRGCRQSRT